MRIFLQGSNLILANEVIERADRLDLLINDKVSLLMDLNVYYSHYNFSLQELLQADTKQFIHDIKAIQGSVDHERMTIKTDFLQRPIR